MSTPEVATHPAPEVACRDAELGEIPAGAAKLAKVAADHGWLVRLTYARGTDVNAKGVARGVVDSVCVRCIDNPPGRRPPLFATWLDGRFAFAQLAGTGRVNVTAATTYLKKRAT